ncbi:MAG: DUF302 domain-containing protein [Desulfitobacteriaceae bacterium]|uniref:DUF302 domain-containing protein n=1 Tax=Desulfosporosinus sp. FKA TaxID=1969834 RepID=UPI000B4A098C|nr:DUF302 domain-containing protein [Desulfosporosinus sp. FKA]MDI6877899.1 DUF302 domain-containing protein [Desulfitobacteriaceae bacterium]MDI6912674.1 DUF302 domain-containing protein [Desulfitobacteriaceae bacterium]
MNNPVYEVTASKSFAETVEQVKEQAASHSFRVLHIHDVMATLGEKGFVIKPLKIIEVCNAKYANTALQVDITVSLLMPCRINVYESENGEIIISMIRPTHLSKTFENPNLEDFAAQVEADLIKIIEASK